MLMATGSALAEVPQYEFKQAVDPREFVVDHPFRISGMQPSDGLESIISKQAEQGRNISKKSSGYRMTRTDGGLFEVFWDVTFSSGMPLKGNPYAAGLGSTNRTDSAVNGELTSPASGSAVASLSRILSREASDTDTSVARIMTSVKSVYGEPLYSIDQKNSNRYKKHYWIVDLPGQTPEEIEMTDALMAEHKENPASPHIPNNTALKRTSCQVDVPALFDEKFKEENFDARTYCGAVLTVEIAEGAIGFINFKIDQPALVAADRNAVTMQLMAEQESKSTLDDFKL